MTKYGKIYIEANSIEEAEKELATIKALVNAGAVYGKGSTDKGVEIRMGNVPSAPPSNYRCTDCSICPRRCREETYHYDNEYEEDDFNGTDDYEEDDYDEVDEMLDNFVMTASPIAQRMIDEILSNL